MTKRAKTGGRQAGTPNKITARVKEAVLKAAETVGKEVNINDGLTGYCEKLAKEEPKAFSGLLAKLLPTQVSGEDGEPIQVSLADGLRAARESRAD